MGQKVNPHGFRVGVIKDWDSRWFAKDEVFGDTLVSDFKVRKYLKDKLQLAGVPKIEIERDAQRVRVFIHCAKPGIVIGRGGTEIDKLRISLEEMIGKPVSVNVIEIKAPDLDAQLVAENIASQLEKRVAFRRAVKLAIQRTMRLGAKGIKISVGGRLNGAEISRTEQYHEGTIPLQTLRADIDYGFWEANTTYGKLGIKVWIYKGEVLQDTGKKQRFSQAKIEAPKQERRGDRRNGDRRNGSDRGGDRRNNGDRRNGDRRNGDRRNDQPRNNFGGSGRVSNYTAKSSQTPAQNPAAPKEGGDA